MSLLRLTDLSVSYGPVQAVAGATLTVAPGEIVALVGRSGSGKSSLAHAALGLLDAGARVAGQVQLGDAKVTGATPATLRALRGRVAGMVFQEPMSALNPLMTIGAQVAEAAPAADVAALLRDVGLDVPPGRYPHQLSGGQRQRVAIAIALAARPQLLVADEPTTALDPVTQAHILALLVRLAREQGTALLLVSHDLALVAGIADRIVVMDGGAIVDAGEAATLLAAPHHPATQALVAASRPVHPRAARAVEPLLEAERLSCRHGATVTLDEVSLTIGRGETVGLIGRSGSGKSTLVRALLVLEPETSGAVRIDGERFTGQRTLRRRIQAVFQDPIASFDPRWTVARIVAEPLALTGEGEPRVAEVLAAVGLDPALAARLPHQLSGGQRQRVAIARALAPRPDLVLLDEALSALDPVARADMLALIADLSARTGTAWLMVSHDIGAVAGAADRLLVLDAGRIVEAGPTADVLADPQAPATRALLATVPHFPAAEDPLR